MIAALLTAVLCVVILVGGFLFWRREYRIGQSYLAQIEQLRAERDRMLNTALEARGVQVIEANQPRNLAVAAPPRPFAGLAGRIAKLEAADAKAARDRDERVAAEIAEKAREAKEARERLSGADA